MQFFWQFPQRTERLALVSSGGLGREVSPLLRSAALPGASRCCSRRSRTGACCGLARRAAGARRQGVRQVARALRPLEEPGSREAFLHTLRSVIDLRGQRVSATDRLYLLQSTSRR